jgi:high-affinity nickel-transport protein
MVHGLAGSGALTLLVLTQISSSLLGFLYVLIFGFGSIVGMLVMSGLIGLPFAFTSRKLTHLHNSLQTLAAVFSICFGIWYAYKAGAGASLF